MSLDKKECHKTNYEEVKKIHESCIEASSRIWNEAKEIPKKHGFDDEFSDLLVAIAVAKLFIDGD